MAFRDSFHLGSKQERATLPSRPWRERQHQLHPRLKGQPPSANAVGEGPQQTLATQKLRKGLLQESSIL